MSEAPFPVTPAPRRHPRIGYAMAAGAASLWAVNGTVSKVILASGISSLRLAQVRTTGALTGLVLILLVTAPARLRVRTRELPYLAFYYNVDTHAVRAGLEGITSRWDRQPGMSFNIYAWRWVP